MDFLVGGSFDSAEVLLVADAGVLAVFGEDVDASLGDNIEFILLEDSLIGREHTLFESFADVVLCVSGPVAEEEEAGFDDVEMMPVVNF